MRPWSRHPVLCCLALLLPACSSLLVYYPSTKYDNKVVRGVVTHIATKEEMAENWDRKAAGTEGVPPREEFVAKYRRVTVTIGQGLGTGTFVYPFIPAGLDVSVGDVVDIPGYVGGVRLGKFKGRLEVSRVVCKGSDTFCLNSDQGRFRGAVSDLAPTPK